MEPRRKPGNISAGPQPEETQPGREGPEVLGRRVGGAGGNDGQEGGRAGQAEMMGRKAGGRGGWDLTRSRLILATVTWELGIGGLARVLCCRKRGWDTSGQYFCNDFTF